MPRPGEWKPDPLPPSIVHGLQGAGFVLLEGSKPATYSHRLAPTLRLEVSAGRTGLALVSRFTVLPGHLPMTTIAKQWYVDTLADQIVAWGNLIERHYHEGPRVLDRILGPGT